MKTVILCVGTNPIIRRNKVKPKPMVQIGKPILSHIMGIYKYYSFNKFVLALGYKSNYIKQYFFNKNYSYKDMIYTGKY